MKVPHLPSNQILNGRPATLLAVIIPIFLILSIQPAFSEDLTEDFKLRKVGSHCEPEMDEWFEVPGRDIKAGSFVIFYDKASGSMRESKTSGVVVNNEAIYYPAPNYWTDEMNFGVYKDYLVMDAWGSGASHNRTMFLFRLGEKSVELLDVIHGSFAKETSISDFMSVDKSRFRYTDYRSGGIIDVADIDNDDRPELKLKIYAFSSSAENFWNTNNFNIYIEIRDDRLKIDLNPKLYRPLFDVESKKSTEKKTDDYYIYGFLAGELELEEIKRVFSKDKDRYEDIVPLLETSDEWDYVNDPSLNPSLLLRYDLKGADCRE